MKLLSLRSALPILGSILLFNCKGPAGDVGPTLKGKITGYVNIYDQYGHKLSDRSGVNVTVDGTTKTATTDASGKYEITDLSTNTYNIIVSKPSYLLDTIKGFGFIGGNVATNIDLLLTQTPTYTASNLSANIENGGLTLTATSSVSVDNFTSHYDNFEIFVGKSNQVSNKVFDYNTSFAFDYGNNPNKLFSSMTVTYLKDAGGFPSGSTVYIIAYPVNNNGPYYYNYTGSNSIHFSSVGAPSNVISVTLP